MGGANTNATCVAIGEKAAEMIVNNYFIDYSLLWTAAEMIVNNYFIDYSLLWTAAEMIAYDYFIDYFLLWKAADMIVNNTIYKAEMKARRLSLFT